jgi:hypothetical protein
MTLGRATQTSSATCRVMSRQLTGVVAAERKDAGRARSGPPEWPGVWEMGSDPNQPW